MKNILLFTLLLCAVIFKASAQTEKGNQNLGLSFGVNTNTETDTYTNPGTNSIVSTTKFTNYSVSPTYSIFVANKLDLGLSVGVTGSTLNYSYSPTAYTPTKTTYLAYSGSLFLRKYLMFGDKIGMRAGPYFIYQRSTQTNDYPAGSTFNSAADNKISAYTEGINADLVFYPTKKIGLAVNLLNINYTHNAANTAQNTGEDNVNTNSFNANFINNSLTLSVFLVLGNK